MTVKQLKINGVVMPTPAYEGITITHEKIWSADTGRTTDGKMVGTIVALKTKLQIKWPPLTSEQAQIIDNAVNTTTGFVPMEYVEIDGNIHQKTVYFGVPTYTQHSWAGTNLILTDVAVDAIEQ